MYCRTYKITAVLAVVVLSFGAWAPAVTPKADFHVSPTGKDANPGTKQEPFATLLRARDAVRQLNSTKTDSGINS